MISTLCTASFGERRITVPFARMCPSEADRRWLPLISTPTGTKRERSISQHACMLAADSASTMLMPPCNSPIGWRARSDIGIRRRMCSESTDTISTPRASTAVLGINARICSRVLIMEKRSEAIQIFQFNLAFQSVVERKL